MVLGQLSRVERRAAGCMRRVRGGPGPGSGGALPLAGWGGMCVRTQRTAASSIPGTITKDTIFLQP